MSRAPGQIDSTDLNFDEARELYEASSNPFYVWMAWQAARQTEGAIPTWVLDYLDRVANEFVWMTLDWLPSANVTSPTLRDASDPDNGTLPELARPRDLNTAVAHALEFVTQGRGDALRRQEGDQKQWYISGAVADFYRQRRKLYLAIEDAAAYYNVSEATVRRAWDRYKHEFEGES